MEDEMNKTWPKKVAQDGREKLCKVQNKTIGLKDANM